MKPFTKNMSRYVSIIPNSDVYNLQRFLESKGYGTFKLAGFFGPKTQSALARFQKENGITPSVGNLASQTRRLINLMLFPKQVILHATAVSLLGVDASPADRAVDEYGCADTVNCINFEAFGYEIGGATATAEMIKALEKGKAKYVEIGRDKATAGTIIISPTEYRRTGTVVGHVGIMMDENRVMSNSSATGLWTQNYTKDSWEARYIKKLGLKVRYFNLK